MARRSSQLLNQLRDADDLVKLVTGRRIPQLVAKGIELFGTDALGSEKAAAQAEREPPPDLRYLTLGVRPEAADIVVKASFRALAREHHPDTGSKPDPAKFQKILEAYNSIMAEREHAAPKAA